MRRFLALAVVVAAAPARAEESTEPGTGGGATPTPNRINLRLGTATTDSVDRPTICVDVRVFRGFGAETCGSGQGVIHDEVGTEMVHFRGTWTFLSRATSSGTGMLRLGAGFAELQVGVDHPGFHFGSPDRVERGSVAGPEVALQGHYLVPLGAGVEAIMSATAGVAAFAAADELVIPKSNIQPFLAFEIGVGW